MKKILFFSMTLFLGLVLSGSGCCHDAVKGDPDYFGTWKFVSGSAWSQVTLAADKLIVEAWNGGSYTMEDLTWAPISNPGGPAVTTHPTGYIITGKLTAMATDWGPPEASDDTSYAAVGDIAADWWYIATDKSSLSWGSWSSPGHPGGGTLYVKQ